MSADERTDRIDRIDRIDRARLLYERSVFGGDRNALPAADRELDAVEADLALARGRVAHARHLRHRGAEDPEELALFERAVELYRLLGDVRGEGEALFWVGTFHQVVRSDHASALPALERSLELATAVEDRLTMSYALRHLGIAAHIAGRLDTARVRLEESVRLRRELGFLPGVAANLVGLAYIAAGQDRRDDALALVEEAAAIVAATGADGILPSVEEARRDLAGDDLPRPL
ncbi:tetratricopeptide repeat protein [Embleya sp. NPDC050154]|uniref:tetratricopeptide repeat protein n=1 Tax=Embleya sp. NPDC050154 TaxID=3363988 RepID=UPI00379B9AD0